MKGSGEFGVLVGDEGQGLGQVVLAYDDWEVGEPKPAEVGLAPAPMHIETDGHVAEHPQNPQAIGVAYPAAVVVERDVQALVRAVLDAPGLAIGLESGRRRQFLRSEVGDEPDDFVLAPAVLTAHQGDLGGEGEADVLGGGGTALQRAALGHPFILLHRACPGRGRRYMGKNPRAGRLERHAARRALAP